MKLMFCSKCTDVVRLWPHEWRTCHCGNARGRLNGTLVAEWNEGGALLAFKNREMEAALRARTANEAMGRAAFTATVIPKAGRNVRIVPG